MSLCLRYPLFLEREEAVKPCKRGKEKLNWPLVEDGLIRHIRGMFALAAGSPDYLEDRYPEFKNPELSLEEALRLFINHYSEISETFRWGEEAQLLAASIIPWISYLQDGSSHPLPLGALHHLIEETQVPSWAGELASLLAQVEIDYALGDL